MTALRLLFITIAIVLFSGCTTVPHGDSKGGAPTTSTLSKNRKIAGADGNITISSTTTNSNRLELNVKHVGALNRISPRAKNYIVWELPVGFSMKPQSLGPLKIDKNYTGRLNTVTPFRNFDIFITAEPALNPLQPTGEKLFWTTVNR